MTVPDLRILDNSKKAGKNTDGKLVIETTKMNIVVKIIDGTITMFHLRLKYKCCWHVSFH